MPDNTIYDILTKGGPAVILGLLLVLVGLYRGWWVPGPYFRLMKDERDLYLKRALQSAEQSERALRVAKALEEEA